MRTVDDVAVPRDPTTVGGTPIDVIFAMIKDPLERFFRVDKL